MRLWLERHDDFNDFADKHCFQLNDTHPSLAVAELMRLLIDEHHFEWDDAWSITSSTMAYTNHTLLPEALECWSIALVDRLLPRLFEIIQEIDSRFRAQIEDQWPGDSSLKEQLAILSGDGGSDGVVRMAHLAIVGSFSVNGVAQLHSDLLVHCANCLMRRLVRDGSVILTNCRHCAPLQRMMHLSNVGRQLRSKTKKAWHNSSGNDASSMSVQI